MSDSPLWHLLRLRSADDLTFVRPGLFDELIVNANHLENSTERTIAHLQRTGLPYMVDPMLWRFQVPEWWRNEKGEAKRNYVRLARAYSKDTSIRMVSAPLLETVASDEDWARLAANTVEYQRNRLALPSQANLFDDDFTLELRPSRIVAPALVAWSQQEDHVNTLLLTSAAKAAGEAVVGVIVAPEPRLRKAYEVDALLSSVPTDGVAAYFLWTPSVSEEVLLFDDTIQSSVIHMLERIRRRKVPIVHLHGSYTTAALHSLGVHGVAYHTGWTDRGEPAAEQGGGPRSCQTYIPGVHFSDRFSRAHALGSSLAEQEYLARYCNCTLCAGIFHVGEHPLDLLLEEQTIDMGNATSRQTPTGRAATANTWHYLLARRQEVEAFSGEQALSVIERDRRRAVALAGDLVNARFGRLAARLSQQ